VVFVASASMRPLWGSVGAKMHVPGGIGKPLWGGAAGPGILPSAPASAPCGAGSARHAPANARGQTACAQGAWQPASRFLALGAVALWPVSSGLVAAAAMAEHQVARKKNKKLGG